MLVPPGTEASPEQGILLGPPDLQDLRLPPEIETRLNNELFDIGLITWEDMRRRANEVRPALLRALRVESDAIMKAYMEAQHVERSGKVTA